MNTEILDLCTHPPPTVHHSSTVMRSLLNSTAKTWYLSLSPLTPGHNLARCYSYSSPPHTIHVKNLGAPHTLTTNIINQTPTSCANVPPNHHTHSGSSHPPTSNGHNLHYQHAGHSLVGGPAGEFPANMFELRKISVNILRSLLRKKQQQTSGNKRNTD